ncbi:M15 family metallopeptidase [Mesorhizobium sp. M1E.F.Ca.ET.063.01.1.1]|uniref:M15 family metallopeptidase n=1 Tax=Mesorhizobium sp. M1E.F.Ca.ET.063.01.1.1 TaxID=2496750 RepID=UPI0016752C5B|nr:M15 family metallopeptidase [Mesorhizobium sp. M1E.F.Ca.ET.063.01.1.1]
MAKKSKVAQGELAYYAAMVPLQGLLPINVGLKPAREETMISALGSPEMPLTIQDQPDRASPLVKALKVTERLSINAAPTGIKPAIASLAGILKDAFAQEDQAGHDLESVLDDDGMLAVRYRRPTNGHPSTKISNHSWGTAIDFRLVGHDPPANTHGMIPRFIAVLLPFFNGAGWYSGISFSDTMHFEVADDTIHKWATDGALKP